ncbi:10343_t:CDS:1, partial [Paraglomus brasilianum]
NWVKVQLPNGGGTQGELRIEAKFFSTSLILEDKFVATVDERLLYILISWRRPDNAFEFSYGLAQFFKFVRPRNCEIVLEALLNSSLP